jgi:preprotein translocase subunit Sss1
MILYRRMIIAAALTVLALGIVGFALALPKR